MQANTSSYLENRILCAVEIIASNLKNQGEGSEQLEELSDLKGSNIYLLRSKLAKLRPAVDSQVWSLSGLGNCATLIMTIVDRDMEWLALRDCDTLISLVARRYDDPLAVLLDGNKNLRVEEAKKLLQLL